MTTDPTNPAGGPDPSGSPGGQPTEEELRAAYEAEIKQIRVEQLLLENVVTMVNMGMRRTGLAPGTEDERDPQQVGFAIEAVRALLPLIEAVAPSQGKPLRDALSQLQLAYVRIGGAPGVGEPGQPASGSQAGGADTGAPGSGAPGSGPDSEPEPHKPGEPGPAQRSGRLWVPGQ